MAKAGFATIIGKPNVGKSTLMNTLIGQKIAITSYKPQTTRNQIRTIYTDERGQIVFLDTPGMHSSKDRLGKYMMTAAESTLKEVDVILWLVEPTLQKKKRHGSHRNDTAGLGSENSGGISASDILAGNSDEVMEELNEAKNSPIPSDDLQVMKTLAKVKTPVILCITKMDEVKKAEALPVIQAYAAAWEKFTGRELTEIIPISSRQKTGLEDLMNMIYDKLPEGEPFYDEEQVTTENMRDIAGEIVREKALRLLQEEVPHGIAVKINKFKYRTTTKGDPIYDVDADVICEREAHKAIVIGKGGEMLKKIGSFARTDIENMTGTKVNLKLFVKVRKDWKDNDRALKELGYNEKDLKSQK